MPEAPPATSPRLSIRIAAVVALAALGIAVWLGRPDEGFVVGLLPLSDREAFVLVRANYDSGPSRGWLVRTASDGRERWRTELPDTPDATGSGHGITTDGRVVVVIAGDTFGRSTIVAIEAATGRIRWRTTQTGSSSVAPILRAHEVVITYGGPHGAIVRGLALADGRHLWTHRAASDIGVAFVDDDARRYAYRDGGFRVIALDVQGDGGNPEARAPSRADLPAMLVPVSGDACFVERTLVMLERGALVRADVSGDSPRIERRALAPSDASLSVTETCGQRGDAFVFFGRQFVDGAFRNASLLVVGPDAELRHRIDLGVGELLEIGGEPDRGRPAYHPLRGSLSAFVPIIVHRGESAFELVVVDLARGAIAWTSARVPELLHYQIVRGHGDVHYLARTGHIVAIDGRDGRVLAATDSSAMGVRGFYATEHTLWEMASDWSSLRALPFVTLDARSLARRAGPNPELPRHSDALARTLTWLAVPAAFRP